MMFASINFKFQRGQNSHYGDSSVLHCASLLRTLFASLARARTQQRNFPQAKLNSEINDCFLLNGHGDLYFLLHNNSV